MLLRFKRCWKETPLKSSYDAVIIGGGLHGLASAYFLASRHGVTDVAVFEKKFIGCGAAGRNTAIVRANQRTQENLPLYKEALALWPILTRELDFNLMFYNCGNLNLAHSDAAMKAFRMNVASAQFHGIDSRLVDAKECKELVPALDVSERPAIPFSAACSTSGGIVRHDAVVWAAKGSAKLK
jgi:sarcosine oxidase subunit beta